MEQQEPLQKRARIAPTELQPQAASPACAAQAQGSAVSSATGTTVAPAAAAVGLVKPAAAPPAASSTSPPSAGTTSTSKAAPAANVPAAPGAPAPKPGAANAKPPSFIADAREAVQFRAVTCRDATALQAEIAAGGAPVHVDFLHQHFGDSEQIRGYSNLKITIWLHVQTYHAWIDVSFATKRPGADKLSDIWEGAFPEGYFSSKVGREEGHKAVGVGTGNALAGGWFRVRGVLPLCGLGRTGPAWGWTRSLPQPRRRQAG